MLKITIILSLVVGNINSEYPPGKFFDLQWSSDLMGNHLINLTYILCKDAFYKLRMADRIQEGYKHSFAYELGLLTSSILDKFKYMLIIYRHYSYLYDFKRHSKPEYKIMNGYHVMQSTYNEIRAERDLFLAIVEAHEKRHHKKKDPLAAFFASKKSQKEKANTFRRRLEDVAPNETVLMDNIMKMQRKRIKTMENKRGNKVQWARNNAADEEYKKRLRYMKWAEKWKGFNPEIEGVAIPDKVANIGLANASDFLLKELKGAI